MSRRLIWAVVTALGVRQAVERCVGLLLHQFDRQGQTMRQMLMRGIEFRWVLRSLR